MAACQAVAKRSSRFKAGMTVSAIGGIFSGMALVAAPLGAARAAATEWVGDEHAAARLVTAVEATGSGRRVDAGLEIRMAPGWHTYWRTPGDAGLPPSIDWSGSINLARAEIAWPAPTRLSAHGLESYVYPDHALLPIAIELARPGESLSLRASVDYAACAEICIPYHADLSLALPAGLATPGAEAPLIAAARARVPGGSDQAGLALVAATVAPAREGDAVVDVRLHSTDAPFRHPDLFIEGLDHGTIAPPETTLGETGHTAELRLQVTGVSATALAAVPLKFTLTDGVERAAEFTATPLLQAASVATPGNLAILCIALLGGLILNLMPCVLPVLSLKLLAVARLSGVDRRSLRLSLVITAGGVLAAFVALAATLILLKAAGASIGWGIQFQQPWFIAGMAVVTALFAANLWGWFVVGLPGAAYAAATHETRLPLVNAFLTGMFATLLATPCSAPFVGTAVGFALSRGPVEILWIFAALGLGLAFPYLLVAAMPRLAGLLPRPGGWMLRVRQLFGLLLAGTAAWLVWVLAEEVGTEPAALTGLLLVAGWVILAWRARPSLGIPLRRLSGGLVAVLAIAAIITPQLAASSATSVKSPAAVWQPFDTAEIKRQVGDGKVVFVDVTAAWCLTCKVNEAIVLDREPVSTRLRSPDIIAMRADWTRPDQAITAYIQSFGRYGIPVNVVYGPGRPDGELLPELLSTELVIKALDHAAGPGVAAR
jgi:suppressor for copper-sensitivity B